MNDKISRIVTFYALVLLCIVAGYSAIATNVELGNVRRANEQLEARNRDLELKNSELTKLLDVSTERLGRIAGRIESAQDEASAALDTIGRIRALINAMEFISQELRKPIEIVQP
jgi:septal ring factor EnvC (AmiA/AmiB activator)